MFDFQKLLVYQKAKHFAKDVQSILKSHPFDRSMKDQLRRASYSILLNIAEGTSRFSKKDKKNFMIIARGSVFECVAILEFLKESEAMDNELFDRCYEKLEELSKMLYGMIGRLD